MIVACQTDRFFIMQAYSIAVRMSSATSTGTRITGDCTAVEHACFCSAAAVPAEDAADALRHSRRHRVALDVALYRRTAWRPLQPTAVGADVGDVFSEAGSGSSQEGDYLLLESGGGAPG